MAHPHGPHDESRHQPQLPLAPGDPGRSGVAANAGTGRRGEGRRSWEHPQLPLDAIAPSSSRGRGGIGSRVPVRHGAVTASRATSEWRMDERTRAAGRVGLAAARAALEALGVPEEPSGSDVHAA